MASVEKPFQIRKILLEGEEPIEADTSGNTPVWEKVLSKPNQQLSRRRSRADGIRTPRKSGTASRADHAT